MTTPSDPTTSVRDAVRSLDTRLDDVRREQAWRAIDRSVDDRPAPLPTRAWRLPVFALATLAVVIALLVAPRPNRARSSSPAAASPSGDATTLSAAAGQRTVFDRDGVTLTLTGPGSVTVTRDATVVRVSVTKGLLVADRTTTAPPLAVDAGDNHVVSRDSRFAVRVEPTMVVLGAGEQARQIVERHAIEMGALPLVTPSGSNGANTTAPSDGSSTTGTSNPTASNTTASNTIASNTNASNTTASNTTAANTTAANTTASNTTAANSTAANPTAANTTAANTTAANPTAANTTARAPSRATTAERRAPVLPDIQMDAAELYKRAEAALAVRDPAGARELLERLLHDYPTDTRVDAARYDLALIARSYGQHKRAAELLDVLIATGTDENLKTAARRLRPTLAP